MPEEEKVTVTCENGHVFELNGDDTRDSQIIASISWCKEMMPKGVLILECEGVMVWRHYKIDKNNTSNIVFTRNGKPRTMGLDMLPADQVAEHRDSVETAASPLDKVE